MTISNATRIELEKRIVRGLIRHMKAKGFVVFRTYDGEDFTYPATDKEAMDAVFGVDEVSLRFVPAAVYAQHGGPHRESRMGKARKLWQDACYDAEHGVLLVLGNGEDVISDWNFYASDRDGFDAAMKAYAYREFV